MPPSHSFLPIPSLALSPSSLRALCAPIDDAHLRLVPLLSLHPFPSHRVATSTATATAATTTAPTTTLYPLYCLVCQLFKSGVSLPPSCSLLQSFLHFPVLPSSFVNSLEPNCLILRILISCPSSKHYFLSQPPFPIFSFFLRLRPVTPART
jgi:hypothetical protein